MRNLSLRRSYRSGTSNIATDFLIPALAAANRYDRAAGYFTATSLKVLTSGLRRFAENGGRMRLVISPELSDEDLKQIKEGYTSRGSAIDFRVLRELSKLLAEDADAASRVAWLIAHGVLEIRFATPVGSLAGIYHEKFGIFYGDGHTLAFTGSLNETGAALSRNIEYIDVFTSWNDPARVHDKITDFQILWDGHATGIETSTLSEALSKELFKIVPAEYPNDPIDAEPKNLTLSLRPRQEEAIMAWINNGHRGLFAMATGTGKTFTSLIAAKRQLDAGLRNVIILVPQIALANQWALEVKRVLGETPIVCHSQSDWRLFLKTNCLLAKTSPGRKSVIVGTYDTAQNRTFRDCVLSLPGDKLLIADEVHNVNEDIAIEVLLEEYSKRIGLSATPQRWMDEDGTHTLLNYFHGITYSYSLSDAIKDRTLTPYAYYPIICQQNDATIDGLSLPISSNSRVSRFESMFPGSIGHIDGFALVYCNYQSLPEVLRYLGHDLCLPVHTFTAEESAEERSLILEQFANGQLHSLVAMKCLDEGIDVPATRTAYLLASSVNPKQFVQRRGRVLRLSKGKTIATIFDFLFLGPIASESRRLVVQNEITRFAEFASVAMNGDEAVGELRSAARAIGIDLADFLHGV